VLNLMVEAPTHVKDAVETRREPCGGQEDIASGGAHTLRQSTQPKEAYSPLNTKSVGGEGADRCSVVQSLAAYQRSH
jgi:hypothetical protein